MSDILERLQRLRGRPLVVAQREVFYVFAFLAATALMTWPWVTRLRDAVYDNGDSYAFAWSLWWNYHQTFHDPLNLFHGNIFFPYRYTLAFTEHGYGVALLCFPLFAAGLRPLTVFSVATFCAFAFCGYGAFRLTRTLTGSTGASLVAGVVFAFIPYRFIFITGLPYLFQAWTPLTLEALVLFARVPSRKRAVWLGVTFLMHGLTCITWLFLSLIPLALSIALLATRHRLWRARVFWQRGLLALCGAALLLAPFLWPYYRASRLYGFRRDADEVTQDSAGLADWLSAPAFNRVWKSMGAGFPNVTATLFTGLLPLLLMLAALLIVTRATQDVPQPQAVVNRNEAERRARWLYVLDALALVAGVWAIIAAGYSHAPKASAFGRKFLNAAISDRALVVLTCAIIARCCRAYPRLLRTRTTGRNLLDSLRAPQRDDAFWLGTIWAGFGFICSFGMYFYFYRVLYDLVLPFQSLRAPSRAAMICYVGLAVLAGLGADKLARIVARLRPSLKPHIVYALLVCALLFELHAAPLPFIRGAVFPDAVTLRLKETPMRGGVLDLPSLPQPPYYSWHLSMLRAADHGRPVVFAASSFTPPLVWKAHELASAPRISTELLDLLEALPISYVVYRARLAPETQEKFAPFFHEATAAGRLRLVARYTDGAELYAVTKTEPTAQADANVP